MKKFSLPGIIIFLVLCIQGCKDESVNPSEEPPLFPLAIGNRWIERETYWDASTGFERFDTITITGSKLIDGERWFIINDSVSYLRCNRIDGYYLWFVESDPAPILSLKYPAKVGDEFIIRVRDSIASGKKIISVDEKLTVPAGTFSCYKYQSFFRDADSDSNTYVNQYDYYAPGVGRIKSEFVFALPGGEPLSRRTSELMSYTLK